MKRSRLFLVAVAAAFLAGCLASPAPAPPASPVEDTVSFSFLDPGAPCSSFCEPSVAVDAAGTLYLLSGPLLRVSTDRGQTFTKAAIPGLPSGAPPAVFANDVLIQTGPDGALYFSALLTSCLPPFVGCRAVTTEGLQVARSVDSGKTWDSNVYLGLEEDRGAIGADRQWLAFGRAGTVCLVYQRYGPLVIFDRENGVPATAVNTRSPSVDFDQPVTCSTDAGKTFGAFHSALGGSIPQQDGSFIGGRPVMTNDGLLCVAHNRYDSEKLEVACTEDLGATFRFATVDVSGNWFPMMALRPDGTLGLAWVTTDGALDFAQSSDRGKTWSAPSNISAPGEVVAPSPWLEGTADGWRAAWFVANQTANDLRAGSWTQDGWATVSVRAGLANSSTRTAGTDYAHFTLLAGDRMAIAFVDTGAKQTLVALEPA